jgi:gliding motility-associated-like protein
LQPYIEKTVYIYEAFFILARNFTKQNIMSIRNLSVLVVFCILSQHPVLAQNYTLINDASQLPGCGYYQLTPDQGDQGGGVYQNNTINLNNSFDYKFCVFLGCNGVPTPNHSADGICFILTNNITGIGANGGGLGYQGLPGNSLAVEYDTWQNGWDPNDHHMAMESQGNITHNVIAPVCALTSCAEMADCQWHNTELIWDVNAQTYSAWFDGILRFTYTGNIVANFFAGNPIVNWGWSGSTGGGYNTQQFCVLSTSNWVAPVNYQSCDLTMQFQDISTPNGGSVQGWAWNFGDPGSGANNTSTIQNPTHTYPAPGVYSVTLTITDVSGCPYSYTHTVTIAPPISMAPTVTDPLCNGGANGSVDVVTSGGFDTSAGYGGYAYTWSNGITGSPDLLGLTAGTYDLTVTDGVCTSTATYTLSQPTAITASTSNTAASCGVSNGTATIVITGGTPNSSGSPYNNVTWDGIGAAYTPPNSYTTGGLAAGGPYVANFTDANGCSAILSYKTTIASLPCGYTASVTPTPVTCFGLCNGTLTLAVTGSGGGVTVTWYNAAMAPVGTGYTVTGLCAGTYTYTYSDNRPTTFSGGGTIYGPGGPITIGLSIVSTSCSYLNNGQAVASVTANGVAPYTYQWSAVGQPNSPTATGLSPGPISVTVTDANGCSATASGTILGHTPVTPVVGTMPDSCFQTNTGETYVTVTGGTPGYTYQWSSGPTGIGDTVYRLANGPYTVTVTDNNGCTATATGTVGQPPLLTATMIDSNVACFGSASGSATVVPAGGNGGFTYVWSGSSSIAATASGLAPNTYYVTVTDSKLCSVVDSATITQPPNALSLTEDSVNVLCFGFPTGSITLTATGGNLPYQTTWSDIGAGTLTRTNLLAGTYSYTVTDAHLCAITGTINITQPPTPFIVTIDSTNILCFGQSTGSITLTQSGGVPPYATPQWYDGGVTGLTRNNLPAGTYYFADSDNNGCIFIDSVHITQPAAPFTVALAQVNELCFNDSMGTITLTLSGGTTPYGPVTWRDTTLTGTPRTGLKAGNYSYIVSDANGCVDSATISITQNPPVVATVATLDSISCFGANDGKVIIGAAGGTGMYSYQYELDGSGTFQVSDTFSGLTPGQHTVTVKDANGCDSSVTFNIFEPTLLTDSILATVNDTCFGYSDGTILATASGGMIPYQYSINGVNYFSSPFFTGLFASPAYTVTVKDRNGCLATVADSITQPTAVVVSPVDSITPTCFNGNNGSFTVIASGGSGGGYTYSLRGGPYQVSDTFTGLTVGSYPVTARDASGCTGSYVITVLNPVPTSFYTSAIINDSCFGDHTGSITITVTGTPPPFTYAWSTGTSTTNVLSGVPTGTYIVTVTDGNGCVVFSADSINTVGQPSALGATQVITPVTCYGGSDGSIMVTGTGGTAPYTNSWSNGNLTNNPTGLSFGTYTDIVTDNNGCRYIDLIQMTQPDSINIFGAVTLVGCPGDSTGSIAVTDTGGTPGYTYVWSNGTTNPTDTGLALGNYQVIVTDSHGCKDTANFYVGEIPPMYVTANAINVLCPPLSNGRVTLSVIGGSPAYHFQWSTGSRDSIVSNLPVGRDSVVIRDARGCIFDSTFVITNDSAFTVRPAPDTVTIIQGNTTDVAVAVTSQGAGGVDTIIWWPANGLSCADCIAPIAGPAVSTQYAIEVVSDSGCISTTQIIINVIPQHQLYIPNAFTPNGDGINDYWEAFGNKKAWIRCSVEVYDRWGEKVFFSTDLDFRWDGKYRGNYVLPGEYVYSFKVVFTDDYSVTNSGSITVIR